MFVSFYGIIYIFLRLNVKKLNTAHLNTNMF